MRREKRGVGLYTIHHATQTYHNKRVEVLLCAVESCTRRDRTAWIKTTVGLINREPAAQLFSHGGVARVPRVAAVLMPHVLEEGHEVEVLAYHPLTTEAWEQMSVFEDMEHILRDNA